MADTPILCSGPTIRRVRWDAVNLGERRHRRDVLGLALALMQRMQPGDQGEVAVCGALVGAVLPVAADVAVRARLRVGRGRWLRGSGLDQLGAHKSEVGHELSSAVRLLFERCHDV